NDKIKTNNKIQVLKQIHKKNPKLHKIIKIKKSLNKYLIFKKKNNTDKLKQKNPPQITLSKTVTKGKPPPK
ncbi:hypothetical protein ACQWF0_25255, partial [Salmonella enterica subsp. enterica serovar Infantis]